MSRTKILSIRVPVELKTRLEREAEYQGVSINQFTNYLLNMHLTQLETISSLENRLSDKSLPLLKARVKSILNKIPSRETPAWDEMD